MKHWMYTVGLLLLFGVFGFAEEDSEQERYQLHVFHKATPGDEHHRSIEKQLDFAVYIGPMSRSRKSKKEYEYVETVAAVDPYGEPTTYKRAYGSIEETLQTMTGTNTHYAYSFSDKTVTFQKRNGTLKVTSDNGVLHNKDKELLLQEERLPRIYDLAVLTPKSPVAIGERWDLPTAKIMELLIARSEEVDWPFETVDSERFKVTGKLLDVDETVCHLQILAGGPMVYKVVGFEFEFHATITGDVYGNMETGLVESWKFKFKVNLRGEGKRGGGVGSMTYECDYIPGS